ncbi:MAG: Asparagine synthetase [Parcubacteria group bacterium GW2011_GWF2_38_76]|nr:MAG: Asparagine synthetase [Parcubacteria group bacterium GW2011_GWF2_38_76]HBM45777.1 asparagine synthase (glutamine-hydrolyzing) [Patescibacteria group bacterium]
MCGILGIVSSKDENISESVFRESLSLMSHRGPDGMNIKKNVGCILGHVRLSIIDLSDLGKQPMYCEFNNKKLMIVFNGEIYNYLEIRDSLLKEGFVFKTKTDTEVLVAAYSLWGENCLDRLNGMFSFAIWDVNRRELFAARDRIGKKPFFYYKHGDTLVFSSEIKAIRNIFPQIQMDPEKFFQYLVLPNNYNSGPIETFFKNIKQLPAGHFIKYKEGGDFLIKKWWSFSDLLKNSKNEQFLPGEFNSIFLDTFNDAVKIRTRSDVKIGLSLSGGIDSTSILSALSKIYDEKGGDIFTFSLCHPGSSTDERGLVQDTVDYFKNKTGTKIIPSFFDFPKTISEEDVIKFCKIHDEPVRSFDVYNQFFLNKKVHESGIKVLLSGQGADEFFWGYPRYYNVKALDDLKRIKVINFIKDVSYISSFYNKKFHSVVLNTFSMMFPSLYFNKRLDYFSHNYFLNKDLLKPELLFNRYNFLNPTDANAFRVAELDYSSLPSLLRDEDINSMSFSVETRAPYLDYRIMELATKIPIEECLKNSQTKYFNRSIFSELIPKNIAWRKTKSGFYEKRTMRYLNNFEMFALKEIKKSDFIKNFIRIGDVDLNNSELLWKLFNVAVLDIKHD